MERRLQAVETRLAIIELEGAYARAFDDHDGDTWSSLFTEDGIYQARILEDARPGSYVRGRSNLRDYCNQAPYNGIHYMHLPQITIDGQTATSRIHLEFYGSFPGSGALRLKMAGYYDVSYAQVDGEWRIARRVTTTFSQEGTEFFGYVPGNGLDSPHGSETGTSTS